MCTLKLMCKLKTLHGSYESPYVHYTNHMEKEILNIPNGSYTGQTLQAIRKSLPRLWFKRTSILPIICRTLKCFEVQMKEQALHT